MDFQSISKRLEYLEKWRELAIRPLKEDTHPDDLDLLEKEQDDLQLLSKKCLQVRREMNQNLPQHELALDHELQVKTSQIPDSGNGLFYEPRLDDANEIREGSILCYYTGHRHNFYSQKYLEDKSYLLHVDGDILVDPRETLDIKARYINDPLNARLINCKFVPDVKEFRCKVVATRSIHPGEELFISYGKIYWEQQPYEGKIFHG
ncbi:hypothetical protein CTEN210_00798 [Chaetoceros tenuissimus]|uniref:SET domain-containing protein n=1 Tax=Chaetoceros tenuissimus TaxID=426638 RepID=A0AAD3CG84_9STRA|nr:hypothetical protein CTEN210_00798 [Chaetoceros tenuissimus]